MTTAPMFKKATKKQLKLRLALAGVSGGGKTYTALRIASHLVPGGRIAVIDTERESAALYSDEFSFDVCPLESFHPQEYINAIHAAEAAGYDIIIIDSLSHAWAGKDGVLEEKEKIVKRNRGVNSYTAWSEAGALQNDLVDAITRSPCHVIATMRSKMEHVQETDERGKSVIRKVGMKVIQRDDLEYEFTLFASMTQKNEMIVEKTRCKALNGACIVKPGKEVADTLRAWLAAGAPEEKAPPPAPAAPIDWESRAAEAVALLDAATTAAEVTELGAKIGDAFPKATTPVDVRRKVGDAWTRTNKRIAEADAAFSAGQQAAS